MSTDTKSAIKKTTSSESGFAFQPMQIVHDFRILSKTTGDIHVGLQALKAQGIGGIVSNMPFDNYMQDASTWRQFREFIRACQEEGMRVWLYDEKGYPSGYAGGLSLAGHPEFEAIGLYRDGANGEITEEISYEGTHNCNNYFARARTINLLDVKAVARFIDVTHSRYLKELGKEFQSVEAFFTDEPSLNVVYLPPLENAPNVPVLDQPDINRKLKPGVPWLTSLSQQFKGIDLTGLFIDNAESTSLRRRFYNQVGQLLATNCFGQIRSWCQQHGKLSSGHLLWEEDASFHTPMYGNFLRCLMQLDIPGIDVLSASPLNSYRSNRLAAVLAVSAAMLNGTRRIFTESSDFVEKMNEKRISSVEETTASLAWQAAMGITDFTYYFNFGVCPELGEQAFDFVPENQKHMYRTPDEYKKINHSITRIVEKLAPTRIQPDVFLYYPVEYLQSAYYPVLKPWETGAKPPKLMKIAESYQFALETLLDAGIVPCLVDGEMLKNSKNEIDGKVSILKTTAKAIVYPVGCDIPKECLPSFECELFPVTDELPRRLLQLGKIRFVKTNPEVCLGIMVNDSLAVLTLVNLTDHEQTCSLSSHTGKFDIILNPYQIIMVDQFIEK